jgi:hypothetical protein
MLINSVCQNENGQLFNGDVSISLDDAERKIGLSVYFS